MSKSKSDKITGKVNAQDWVTKNGYPEVGQFDDQKWLQKFYKQLDTEQLEEWASIEGLEFKACPESPQIHRMRVAMSILYKHFPKAPAKGKEKSKYSDYTLEDLVTMCIDKEVPVETTEDDRIMRMRCIMALRAAKVIE